MPFQLQSLEVDHPILRGRGAALTERIDQHLTLDLPRYRRLWSYYRNAMTTAATKDDNGSVRPYRQAQEWGLPPRIIGNVAGMARKEVVIENDIAWRVDALIDLLFGQPIEVKSLAAEPRRETIEKLIRQIISHNGGIAFLQRMALLGAVYGFVDVLVKFVPPTAEESCAGDTPLLGDRIAHDDAESDLQRLASMIRFEVVEPTRAMPILSEADCECVDVYTQVYTLRRREPESIAKSIGFAKLQVAAPSAPAQQDVTVIELISPTRWQRYENQMLVEEGENSLGRVPLVHIQNTALPFEYAGVSEVEPLLPLQDELNTRLSDRAYRITMQSFKMYLGKGLDDFINLPVSPGRMWSTDNPNAQVIEFGGDSACPSEESHIAEIREALDKTSGVSPIAAGAVKGRIGQLTSAAALRVTLQAMLSRLERKRSTYGPAIAQLCELSLAWLDRAGEFRTTPAERRSMIVWPDPLPMQTQKQKQVESESADASS
jgi:hypothetical protein